MAGHYKKKRTITEQQKKDNCARRVERRQQQLEHEKANDDPHYVPEGKARKTDEFFAKYGWRERHYTMRDFPKFSPIDFWKGQKVVPEKWDTTMMAEKRKPLNHILLSSDRVGWQEWGNMALFFTRAVQGIFIPREFVNRLRIFTWEQDVPERQHSIEFARYERGSSKGATASVASEEESEPSSPRARQSPKVQHLLTQNLPIQLPETAQAAANRES